MLRICIMAALVLSCWLVISNLDASLLTVTRLTIYTAILLGATAVLQHKTEQATSGVQYMAKVA